MTDDDLEEGLRATSPDIPEDWATSLDGQRVLKQVQAKNEEIDPVSANPAQSFDPIAEVYDRFAELTGEPLLCWLRGVLPLEGAQALDLGCGSGRHTVLLADRYEEVMAVDLSRPMLELARVKRSRPNVVYVESDLREVRPERDGPFDLVLSVHTLHHVVELEAVLQQIRSLVAPGGLVVLVDIVDRRGRTPRWRRYVDAARRLPADLMQRDLREALEVYGLRTHPAWLAHLDTDRYLTPEAFERWYGAVFPGARFVSLDRGRVKAMWWRQGECEITAVTR
jgi:2-polyprenyl-3-methyl-5-hydroxy-6-metoxy-1,4-benzoquinol methylase